MSKGLGRARGEPQGRIIIVRGHLERLLSLKKPLRDQLCIELPCLEGLRTGEVSTLRAEWIDLGSGDFRVLDSKKRELFTLPLDPTVAVHLAEYINLTGITRGCLIQGRKHTGKGLETETIERIWAEYCVKANVPIMNPRLGRAYIATVEHFVLRKPTAYIQWLLRHDNLQSTEHYLSRIVDYEDMKSLFYQDRQYKALDPMIRVPVSERLG